MLREGILRRHLGRGGSRFLITATSVALVTGAVLALAVKLGLMGGSSAAPHPPGGSSAAPHPPGGSSAAPHSPGGSAIVARSGPTRTAVVATTPVGSREISFVAQVRGPSIGVYRRPGAAPPRHVLANPNPDGAPLVFLLKARRGDWLEVYLPTRPNLSRGWIRSADVTIVGDPYRVRVNLPWHRLAVWHGAGMILRVPIGVGRAVTPTPAGRYFITELLAQPDPYGEYGPYAFGLSAHSGVLHEFDGANGEIGIHGTDFPHGIGTDVSHGCIRLSNPDITRLAHLLPLGTPVTIVR